MKKSLKEIREQAKSFYKKIDSVYCPYFKEKIIFSSEGFNHLRYRGSRKERHFEVQKMRYKLLSLAPTLLKHSGTLQEHEVQNIFIELNINKRRKKVLMKVHFFGFIAIIQQWKIKVIVRQIEKGKKHFWSVIPNWKTRKSKEKKILYRYTGNLAED